MFAILVIRQPRIGLGCERFGAIFERSQFSSISSKYKQFGESCAVANARTQKIRCIRYQGFQGRCYRIFDA